MEEKVNWYSEIDDCILGAYEYVKEFNDKVSAYDIEDTVFGLKSKSGICFLIHDNNLRLSTKNSLAKLILHHKINVLDFINKQLMAFL